MLTSLIATSYGRTFKFTIDLPSDRDQLQEFHLILYIQLPTICTKKLFLDVIHPLVLQNPNPFESRTKTNVFLLIILNRSLEFTFNVISIVKYFLLSPTRNALLTVESSFLTKCSIWTGGIFSPPAVIINSFKRPVMYRNPFSSKYPMSPECSL